MRDSWCEVLKARSRFPEGMTERKARATKARATAKAKATAKARATAKANTGILRFALG
jgi:hypothetical protein